MEKQFKLLNYLYEAKNPKNKLPLGTDQGEEVPQQYVPMGAEDQVPQDYQGAQQTPGMMQDPNMVQDPNAMGGMAPQVDAYGMPIEPPMEPEEIGKVYMLLKVYSRLTAISRVLDELSDEKYDDIKYSVGEALDLFKTIVLNYDSFKQKEGKIDIITNKYKSYINSIAERLKSLGDK